MKKLFITSIALFALFFTGCGYRVGSLMHPQIKSIAIAPVTNDTMMYNVAAQMRGLLAECFQSDGSLKLVNEGTADCILYAKVTSATFSQVSWSTMPNISLTSFRLISVISLNETGIFSLPGRYVISKWMWG